MFLGWFRYPYVTGTSVVALKYKDGILMAADMGGSNAKLTHPPLLQVSYYSVFTKVFRLN
jgi:hypothetical protein